MNPRPVRAAVEDLVFSYHNDRVFLITHDTPLLRILETIAVAADISIHLMEPPTATLSIELYDRTLEDTLRALLLGSSYAVVYEAGTPPVVTYRQGTRTLPGVGPAAKTTGPRRTPAPGRSGGPSRTRPGTAPVTTDPGAVSGSDPSLPPGATSVSPERSGNGAGGGNQAQSSAGSQASTGTGAETGAAQAAAGTQTGAESPSGVEMDASSSEGIPPTVRYLLQRGASAADIDAQCQQRMADLETRIATWESDSSYDHFLTHDRKVLDMYETYVSSQ
jgi:hypothetical protein